MDWAPSHTSSFQRPVQC
uniref:Uncharacterized protein n=1 Tax=Arundo donax TaxID=35708 RepID=A0A0A9BY54_ARUDO